MAVRHDQILDRRGDHIEICRRLDSGAHGLAIELAVGLGARALNGGPLRAVQHAELNAGLVGDAAHQPVQRVDLADQMALAEPANGRIAGHLADGLDLVRDQRRARAHARGRGRGLATGVSAANHDHIIGRVPHPPGSQTLFVWESCAEDNRFLARRQSKTTSSFT